MISIPTIFMLCLFAGLFFIGWLLVLWASKEARKHAERKADLAEKAYKRAYDRLSDPIEWTDK